MRTVGALLVLTMTLTWMPLAAASSPVEDVVDGPCPGLVPTVMCAVDPVVHEVNRDVGIVSNLVWQVAGPVYRATCDIVYGDPNGCPIIYTMDITILDDVSA